MMMMRVDIIQTLPSKNVRPESTHKTSLYDFNEWYMPMEECVCQECQEFKYAHIWEYQHINKLEAGCCLECGCCYEHW